MWTLYADEVGHDGDASQGSPIFGLAGFAIPTGNLRKLAGPYWDLKRRKYRAEFVRRLETVDRLHNLVSDEKREKEWRVLRNEAGLKGLPESQWKRIEQFEAKPRYSPPRLVPGSRGVLFGLAVLDILSSCGAQLFAVARVKRPGPPDRTALYTSTAQALVRVFGRFLESKRACGMLVLDNRAWAQNSRVLASVQGYVFGEVALRSLVESPFFVDSRWSPGVQVADIMSAICHSLFLARSGSVPHAPAEQLFGGRVDALSGNGSTVFLVPAAQSVRDICPVAARRNPSDVLA